MTPLDPSTGLWASGGAIFSIALFLFASGLAHSASALARHLSVPAFAIAMGLGVSWFSGRPWLGGIAAMAWIAFPLAQMARGLLKVRVARYRQLTPTLTYAPEFAELRDRSKEWEDQGFEIIDDCELHPGEPRQVFRFLAAPDQRHLVTLGWISQDPWILTYSALSSWAADGRHWMTWNYPLPYGLKTSPDVCLWRCRNADTAEALLGAHLEFLRINDVSAAARPEIAEPDGARDTWLAFMHRQLEHNLSVGWLHPVDDGKRLAYSLRGLLGAFSQFFRTLLETR
ncbi:MAG TPA: hypothetical protein PLU30_15745 [Verrucomicrobiae bacterium]|nr:hypothetical protein [Verrucomicrobiae bacterium]